MESGFSDPMYFDHCFTRHYGCSPREFRIGCRSGIIKLTGEISRILQPENLSGR